MKMRRSDRHVIFVAWALAVSLCGFLLSVLAVQSNLSTHLDRRLLMALRDPADLGDAWGPIWLEKAVAEISTLGGYPIVVLVSVLTIGALLIANKRGAALFLFLALAGGSIASAALKLLFDRPRPDVVDHLDRIFTSSFPSAHAMMSMVTWLTLAAVTIRFVERRRLRAFILSSALFLAALIGVSRVYLGVHWPSDVLAGWFVGIAWASGCWLLAHRLARQPDTLGKFGTSE
jgi:undecaprenyl-diphosphatase